MSDPRLPRASRGPSLADRRAMTQAQVRRPGRDPAQPYLNTHASLASLAKHLKLGLDRSKVTTVIATHTLEMLLDHVIALGFGAAAVEKYQYGADWAADLAVAQQAAAEAQAAQAAVDDENG